MKELRGHLLLGGIETGHRAAKWQLDIAEIDRQKVVPPERKSPPRMKGVKGVNNELTVDKYLDMSVEEYAKYRQEWLDSHSPRSIGGITDIVDGDYLIVYESTSYEKAIFKGTVCLAECVVTDYSAITVPDFEIETTQVGVDVVLWSNMFVLGLPAVLFPGMDPRTN